MEYQALYRKYRPKNFDEVAGQNVTLKILSNAIKSNKVAHAYLFFGPRGTGKTSIAKIFARTVNCLSIDNNNIPCEKCDNCIISKEKECIDIIEIDAASNNGVDEIRELKNKVSFVPSELKYKVYIIDEVHMLSIGAFNALLKTLEEPPSHAIFILATTEFNKVPATIVSRCQTLEFKKINDNDMKNKLKEISNNESIKISDESISEIVRNSNGGLRDAIGLLEKVYSYVGDKEILVSDVREVSGNIPKKDFDLFIKYFENMDYINCLKLINNFYDSGFDLIKLVAELIEYKKDNIVLNEKWNTNECSIANELVKILDSMKKSDNPKIIFEIMILDILCNDRCAVNNEINSVEEKKDIKDINNTIEEYNTSMPKNTKYLKEIRVGNTLCNPQKPIISNIRSAWNKLKDLAFDTRYGNIARLLSSDITPVAASDTNVILVSKLNGLAEQINDEIDNVAKIFEICLSINLKPICISEKEWSEYIRIYKNDKNYFKFTEEKEVKQKSNLSLREKAKELFEDI